MPGLLIYSLHVGYSLTVSIRYHTACSGREGGGKSCVGRLCCPVVNIMAGIVNNSSTYSLDRSNFSMINSNSTCENQCEMRNTFVDE